jgi:hypothetical protein
MKQLLVEALFQAGVNDGGAAGGIALAVETVVGCRASRRIAAHTRLLMRAESATKPPSIHGQQTKQSVHRLSSILPELNLGVQPTESSRVAALREVLSKHKTRSVATGATSS